MKKIVITGARGWVGRNVVAILRPHYDLILIDKPLHAESRFTLEGIKIPNELSIPEKDVINMDLSDDARQFDALIEKEGPDCVIHSAGLLFNHCLSIKSLGIDVITQYLKIQGNG